MNRITKMVSSLEKQLQVIVAGLINTPNNLNLLKSQMEVENQLELATFELTDVVEVKTTVNEGMCWNAQKLACRDGDFDYWQFGC